MELNVIAGEKLKDGTLLFIGEDGKAYGARHLVPPAPPYIHWEITKKQLHDLLHGFIAHNVSMDLADGLYRITTVSEFRRFWELSLIHI